MPHLIVLRLIENVFQARLDEALHLVPAEIGLHEFRMVGVELQQPVLICREPEEIVLLGNQLGGAAACGAIHRFGRVADVGVVVDAVAALVFRFVDRALLGRQILVALECTAHQSLHGAFVFGRGRANEIRRCDSQQFPQIAENLFVLVDELLRRDARLFRRALDIHAVLVRAGQVRHVVAAHPLVACDHIADDRRIRGADVRPRIRVVNRRRQIVLGLAVCAVRLIHGVCASDVNPLRNCRKRYYSARLPLSNLGRKGGP